MVAMARGISTIVARFLPDKFTTCQWPPCRRRRRILKRPRRSRVACSLRFCFMQGWDSLLPFLESHHHGNTLGLATFSCALSLVDFSPSEEFCVCIFLSY